MLLLRLLLLLHVFLLLHVELRKVAVLLSLLLLIES